MADNNDEGVDMENSEKIEFKKPVLIGRVGKLPKKAKSDTNQPPDVNRSENSSENPSDSIPNISAPSGSLMRELPMPISYKEPKWSGPCPEGSEYALEVLKSGMIVERIELMKQAYFVFGRLVNCDVVLAHPTVSRHHAVIQYKAFSEEGEPSSGWYLYDLGSTHGTFLNREKVKPHHYTRVRVGHQMKFGNSTRTYILLGPDFDCEGESELTVTEIKKRAQEMKLDRDRMIKEAIEKRELDRLEEERKREEQGIDWGMGEDAEEEPDLADNPYAVAANEELYLDDPKKTLRGYFEREGHELTYDCEERGVGQYICRVELPMDDARGRAVVAEVIHRGKKKEAVVACALEACRVLDRAGLLRQAKHESRRRKQRDWGADDYYDSDEDTFLDRTGSVESKRHHRMRRHGALPLEEQAPRTYDDLLKEISEIESKIASEEKVLERLRANKPTPVESTGEDALDEYMNSLGKQGHSMAQKAEISKTKMSIQKLKAELSKTHRLADIARPADAPPLLKKDDKKIVKITNSVVYGKRIRLKEDKEKKPKPKKDVKAEETEFVEEMDSDEEQETVKDTEKQTESKTDKEVKDSHRNIDKSKQEKMELEDTSLETRSDTEVKKIEKTEDGEEKVKKRVFGPMRPPENYVVPENYFDQETDRDLPEIEEKENI